MLKNLLHNKEKVNKMQGNPIISRSSISHKKFRCYKIVVQRTNAMMYACVINSRAFWNSLSCIQNLTIGNKIMYMEHTQLKTTPLTHLVPSLKQQILLTQYLRFFCNSYENLEVQKNLSSNWHSRLFSALLCLTNMNWCCKETLVVHHSWEFECWRQQVD